MGYPVASKYDVEGFNTSLYNHWKCRYITAVWCRDFHRPSTDVGIDTSFASRRARKVIRVGKSAVDKGVLFLISDQDVRTGGTDGSASCEPHSSLDVYM